MGFWHHVNAPSPILVTLLGISILVSDEQYANAYSPMLVTETGMGKVEPCTRVLLWVWMIKFDAE